MKKHPTSLRVSLLLAAVAVFAVSAAHAQESRDLRLISARAGGVNFVSGDVTVRSKGETRWRRLSQRDDLVSGDAVRTGDFARAEVLLNPGSYLRVGEASEFLFADSSLENLRVKVLRGSIMVEVAGYDGAETHLVVETPQTKVTIVRSGLYRVNVLESGLTEVAVHKGRAYVGEGTANLLKGGRVARVGAATGLQVVKLDKKMRDELDLWSKERAKLLAEANRKVEARTANALLASTNWNDVFSRRDLGFDYGNGFGRTIFTGIWYYDPTRNCYTFIPGSYRYYSSPYGYSYGSYVHGYVPRNLCPNCPNGMGNNPSGGAVVGNQGQGNQGNVGGNTGGQSGGAVPAPQPAPRFDPPVRHEPPPAPRHDPPTMVDRGTDRAGPGLPVRDQ